MKYHYKWILNVLFTRIKYKSISIFNVTKITKILRLAIFKAS